MKNLNVINNYFFGTDIKEVGFEALWFYVPPLSFLIIAVGIWFI